MTQNPKSGSTAVDETVGAAQAPGRLLIRVPLAARWRDLDAFNHVNNASFLTYLEEARLEWLTGLDTPWVDDNLAPILAAAHVNYRRPIGWPEHLVIELYAGRVGNSSLTIAHRIVSQRDPGVLYADGHVVMVWIDRRSARGSALPAGVRAACTGAPGA
ncbi:MAG TPA: thioesterase family protein [Xanthomonadaceae bacterium]|nr:thioesterase family protein [Xanthomonadaceae bacterium]